MKTELTMFRYVCLLFPSLVVYAGSFCGITHFTVEYKGQSGSNFILSEHILNSRSECIELCLGDDRCVCVEYSSTTDKCVTHSSQPEALTTVADLSTNIYIHEGRREHVPDECVQAMDSGYTYNSLAHLCYKVHLTKVQWDQAEAMCVSEGGHLLKMDTEQKTNLIESIVSEDGTNEYFLGGKDTVQDGVWRWNADNSLVEGFSKTGSTSCLEIEEDLTLDDTGCSNQNQTYFCEILLP